MDRALDQAPCGYLSFRDDGSIIELNQTLSSWLGYEKDLLAGKNIETILSVATKIFHQTHFFPILKLEGKAEEIFLTLRTSSGADIPVLANSVRRVDEGQPVSQCVFIPLHQRRKYEDEILKAKRTAEEALRTSGHFQQLSESLEQRTLELDRLLQKQKVFHNNLVQFSKIISHDLQEPLRKIEFFSMDVLKSSPIDDKGRKALEKVLASAARLRLVTKGLQQYMEIEEKVAPVSLDLKEVIENAIQKASENRQFHDFDIVLSAFPVFTGYKRQIELMFYHLVDNSIQFRDPSRKLKVSVSGILTDENIFKETQDRYSFRQHVRITYEDNALGFDKQYSNYVFDLLNKINAKSLGLGIGLSLIKKIVDNHSGAVEVTSRKNEGTKFTFLFPVTEV